MLKYQLQSGKKLEINIAPVEVGFNLYRTILVECQGTGLNLEIATEDTVKDLIFKNMEATLKILSSEAVIEATKDCCTKVVYDKQRFSMDVFENIDNRKDFIPVMMIVAIENIKPFFAAPHIILDSILPQFLI